MDREGSTIWSEEMDDHFSNTDNVSCCQNTASGIQTGGTAQDRGFLLL